MRRNILITITLIGIQVLFGFSPTSCTYNVSTNILSIQFNEPVNTNNVLLGLLSISDGQTTLSFTGGDILNPDELANNVDINMVYGTIVESRGDFHYWGRTNLQAIAIEEMDLNNLSLNITAGTFINGLNQPNAISESIDIIVTDIDDSVPQITNVEYDAGQNLLHFNFDRLVQFDQIAEDRSCSGGTGNCPGNGALDGNPSEDTNGNGVLEMESNINPFKIHFYSGENELTLEGFRSVVQTSDSDVISLYPTISDAKKLELNIIESATTDIFAVITKGAFVDLDYNPNQTDTLALDIQVDALPLEITDATYDLGLNEFRFYFANSRNVEIFDPFPVYSKIKIISGENETNLNGVKQKSFSGNTLILTELLFSDQEVVEQLILNTPENNTIFVELDAYAVYDVNGNGNIPGTMPLTILEDTNNPVLTASSYDASTNRIILDWSPATVTYYETTRLFETVENMSISGITVSNLTTGEVLILQNANVSRDGTKHLTYLEVSEENSGWFELSSTAGDQLSISIEPYVFYSSGNTNNNGNLAEEAIMTYIADSQGPGIESIKIDFEAKQLLIGLDKNVQTDYSSFDSVTLIINNSEIEITGLNLVNSELTSNSLIYDIADAQFNDILTAMPMNEVVNVSINVPEGVFNTVDNVPGLGCQDLNNNGECDLLAEPFDDYGIDNIMNANEEGYPGSCDPAGGCSDPVFLTESECEAYVCSDPQFTNMNDCLEPGVCSRPFWGDTREECEGHVPPGIWYSDNTWAPSGEWTDFATESLCNNGGATWTPNLDPSGDNYDPITNPTGTENNGLYDEGENYTELYVNGMWDPYEPTTKRLSYGKTMWNQSHRAFPDPAAQMFFVLPYQNSEVEIYVEESVWNGRCHDGDINSGSGCTDSNMEYINGRCVFLDIASEEECLSIPGIGDWEATWTRVTQEDVVDVADFFLSHKDELITMYGSPGEKIPIVLYDISDEFGKGANDTNSSLFTHGYFSIDESSGVGQNAGDILYLDVFPQAVYNGVSDIPDESTMYNALVHEFTKMLITINEPEEEVWLKEGLAYFEQKRLLGETKFFGNGTNPGRPPPCGEGSPSPQ
ncbi:MAG: hypothetical protein ACE5D7_03790, partial [Fidelibacterota bacterium]